MLLSDIVTDICNRAGIDTSSINVSALSSDDVVGYTVTRQMQARTSLETLMAAYSFDVDEQDWGLVFRKRGSTSVAAIASHEMRAHNYNEAIPDKSIETRTQDLELPTHLTLSYDSKVRDYQIASQNAIRIDKQTISHRETSLGIILTDDHAKQQAEIILKQLWTNRHRYAFSTTYKYLKLTPGDVITVNGKLMRVIEMADRDGIVDFVCESEQGGTYQSSAEADDLTIQAIDLTASTHIPTFITMDMPTYDEDVGSAGLWFAVYSSVAYAGGTIERSLDGAVYEPAGYFGSVRAIVGNCQNALSSGIAGIIDNSTTLTVDLSTSGGSVASVATSNLWENGNLAAIGCATAGWEIMQFQTATTTTSANVYQLTGFLRGLYGTENVKASHSTNDKFVLLRSTAGVALGGVEFVGANLSAIGSQYLYRIKNSDDNTGTPSAHTIGRKTLDPYAPQIAFGSRNSSNDIDLNWYRGDRYEFEQDDMPDGADVAMNEVSLNYMVNVIHPVSSAVLRTVQTTASTWTYTAAMQSSDSYPNTHPIIFDIYQLSTVTSTAGLALRASI